MFDYPGIRKTNFGFPDGIRQDVRAPDNTAAGLREWLGLRELSVYANVCERTLRLWIRSPRDPLPATKVRGKVLVRRSDFDRFLERHRVQPLAAVDVDRILDEVLGQQRRG
ncbi:MAG: helix-turn-helix domain-containing protein [Terriglobia bacterium]